MIASIRTRRSRGLDSTRLPSNARAQRRTVDRLSDIERSRLNRAFGDPGATLTKRFMQLLKHTNVEQTKFIILNSQ